MKAKHFLPIFLNAQPYARLQRIKDKQKARLQRVEIVIHELQKWSDIPISWQFTSLCKTLKIVPNQAAKSFIHGLLLSNLDAVEHAKKLPLE